MITKERWLGLIRISIGLVFLWAFFDKLFGLGLTTASDKSWLLGNSPTFGFLANSPKGPFAQIFKAMAGNAFIDWLFMIGLLVIGIGLTLGVAKKFSSYAGTVFLMLIWLAVLPPEHHPFLDEHVIYSMILIYLANVKTAFSLEEKWQNSLVACKVKFLR